MDCIDLHMLGEFDLSRVGDTVVRRDGRLHHPQLLKEAQGPLTSWWLESFFLMKTWSGLHSPVLRMAVAANLCIFIFILKVLELPRCFEVFELAGELFYFIRSYIQKVFHFEFYHFL